MGEKKLILKRMGARRCVKTSGGEWVELSWIFNIFEENIDYPAAHKAMHGVSVGVADAVLDYIHELLEGPE